jgi:hypothetical protein
MGQAPRVLIGNGHNDYGVTYTNTHANDLASIEEEHPVASSSTSSYRGIQPGRLSFTAGGAHINKGRSTSYDKEINQAEQRGILKPLEKQDCYRCQVCAIDS